MQFNVNWSRNHKNSVKSQAKWERNFTRRQAKMDFEPLLPPHVFTISCNSTYILWYTWVCDDVHQKETFWTKKERSESTKQKARRHGFTGTSLTSWISIDTLYYYVATFKISRNWANVCVPLFDYKKKTMRVFPWNIL